MNQDTGLSGWINAYLEWNESESGARMESAPRDIMLASSEEIAAAYLDWIDRSEIDALSREAMLLTALRTEAEFVEILRQLMAQAPRFDATWPQAIDLVAADVRALSGKVRASALRY